MGTTVLMHLAGGEVGVRRNQELLGLQGKRKTVRKRIARGLGIGGEMKLGCESYKYEDVEPGFAEHDLEDYEPIAEDLAWSRTLRTLREAFEIKVDVERIRDQHAEGNACELQGVGLTEVDVCRNISKALDSSSAKAKVVYTPTLMGSVTPEDLKHFYDNYLQPNPADLNYKLISRTVGTDRVVDEVCLSFQHDREIPWLLPGIPPTHKHVEITLVSIVCVKGGLLAHEHVYWDQASVLVQIGVLDPKNVPRTMQERGVKLLPVVGLESAKCILGKSQQLNSLIK